MSGEPLPETYQMVLDLHRRLQIVERDLGELIATRANPTDGKTHDEREPSAASARKTEPSEIMTELDSPEVSENKNVITPATTEREGE